MIQNNILKIKKIKIYYFISKELIICDFDEKGTNMKYYKQQDINIM